MSLLSVEFFLAYQFLLLFKRDRRPCNVIYLVIVYVKRLKCFTLVHTRNCMFKLELVHETVIKMPHLFE